MVSARRNGPRNCGADELKGRYSIWAESISPSIVLYTA
jgi:hypothetical protein